MKNWMEDNPSGKEMRTAVKVEMSEWRKVKIGVQQRSVLAPIMFLIYIQIMPKEIVT